MKKEETEETEEQFTMFVAASLEEIRTVVREELVNAVDDLFEGMQARISMPPWVKSAEEALSDTEESGFTTADKHVVPKVNEGSDTDNISNVEEKPVLPKSEIATISEGEAPPDDESEPSELVKRSMKHPITVGNKFLGFTVQEIYDKGKVGLNYLKLLATSSLHKHREHVIIVLDHYGVDY